ncbi:MAG: hypothetical protein AAFX40_11160 [Cyanobacteria bacterium J06639_1]
MAGIGDIVQKAFYLGIGAASLAADKAGSQLGELRKQAQKLADEMVERGEMTADEAKGFVSEILKQNAAKQAAEAQAPSSPTPGDPPPQQGPRPISIDDDDAADTTADTSAALDVNHSDRLRQEVSDLQAELERLRSQ